MCMVSSTHLSGASSLSALLAAIQKHIARTPTVPPNNAPAINCIMRSPPTHG